MLIFFKNNSQRQDDLRTLLNFDENEVYVDLGAYDGDTIKEFLQLTQGVPMV